MRTWITVIAPAFAVLVPSASLAADVSPGLWEISVETRVAASPGFAPEPFKLTQCFTSEDTRDPAQLLGRIANPGASDCTYGDRSYSGNTLTFSMKCGGAFAIESRGQVGFSAERIDGSIAAIANVGGARVETRNKISARRIGGC